MMDDKRALAAKDTNGTAGLPPPPSYISTKGNDTAEQAPAFRTTFACVSMHMRDRLRFLGFSQTELAQIQEIVRQGWARGIQDTCNYDVSYEIKLHGHPWGGSWSGAERVEPRRLVSRLLEGLMGLGWVLKASVDISKKEFDKDTLLFRHQSPPPPPCTWMSISFDKGDLLHLIDAPQDLGHALTRLLGPGTVQNAQPNGSSSVFEIKFRGRPWRADGTDTVKTRLILLTLLECLEQHGFSLYASIDQDNGPGSGDSSRTEADTWFCCRQLGSVAGAPIYHG